MPTNKNNLTDADANAMGRELIFTIYADNLAEFKTLIENGANVNFRDENSGNTLLHFLYYYGKRSTQYLKLLLEKAAKISTNKDGKSPLMLAEKSCNAIEFQKIKDIFESYNTQSKPNKTGLIPYPQQNLAITIAMPISALFSGVLAGAWEEVAQRNKEQYSYLPNLIFIGLQPISLAMGSALMNSLVVGSAVSVGIEDVGLSFAFYLGINYWSLLIAQVLEIFSEKIQNKILNILIPIAIYTIYLNPNMLFNLLSDAFVGKGFQAVMMPLLSTLSSGAFFKASKYATHKVSSIFFKDNSISRNNYITQPEIEALTHVNTEDNNLLETNTCLELKTFRAN
ncbi:ankyrin repeat domain-containing protein [Rickettsiella endosymbiont of Rhagonycha lignosa]|uniref:ankyrin repeat domain-containing protein n=1 Tax=Rickettsiella endosymbiont of Rhagonycha lignosa TaxID=3077937 RepID=UPI00313A87E6